MGRNAVLQEPGRALQPPSCAQAGDADERYAADHRQPGRIEADGDERSEKSKVHYLALARAVQRVGAVAEPVSVVIVRKRGGATTTRRDRS